MAGVQEVLVPSLPLARFRDEMDGLFNQFFGNWPFGRDRFWAMDFDENEKEFVVKAEAPGFDASDLDVSVSGNLLTIKAEKKKESESEPSCHGPGIATDIPEESQVSHNPRVRESSAPRLPERADERDPLPVRDRGTPLIHEDLLLEAHFRRRCADARR